LETLHFAHPSGRAVNVTSGVHWNHRLERTQYCVLETYYTIQWHHKTHHVLNECHARRMYQYTDSCITHAVLQIRLITRRERRAHLRAVLSATITSADAPKSSAWHHALQQSLRRAAAGILRADDHRPPPPPPAAAAVLIVMQSGGRCDCNPGTFSKASSSCSPSVHPVCLLLPLLPLSRRPKYMTSTRL